MRLGRSESEKLPKLKLAVETWHQYFKRNNQRFWDYYKFTCASNISNKERAALQALNKPQLQFNIMESQVSRLRGEFAKHSPTFEVRAADGIPISEMTHESVMQGDVIEGHLLALFGDNTNDSLKYKFYTDVLIGGYSVGEVLTRYINPMSFEQAIAIERIFDPTLSVFDPMARLSHKGDGEYCAKLIPMTVDDFKETFNYKGDINVNSGSRNTMKGFSWTYKNQKEACVMVAHMYVKVYKKMKIVKLTNGHTVPLDHYEKLLEAWDEEGLMMVPPKPLEERTTEIETIDSYQFFDDGILDRKDTDFTMFPLVYIDGNSCLIRGEDVNSGVDIGVDTGSDSDNGPVTQMIKPYVMHAKDIQLLMNFAGQSLAAEMQNVVQHQYIVAVEAVPEDQQDAYTNPQIASSLQYNYIYDKEAQITLPKPEILQRRQIPPEYTNTFNSAPNIMQMILGNYDGILGINDKQISGVAIQQGALQSNAAALPYFVGFNNGLTRMAEIVMDLIPKYYRTPRSLPIIKPDGKRDYQIINQKENPSSVNMVYDPKKFQLKVEMGVSAAVQKQVALDQIIKLMSASEDFANFINSMGLEVILDNMDIRGIDHLKELSVQYMQKKQEASQQPPQPTDAQVLAETEKEISAASIDQKREQAQLEQANKATELAIKEQETQLKFIELMSKIEDDEKRAALARQKVDAENARTGVEMSLEMIDRLMGR